MLCMPIANYVLVLFYIYIYILMFFINKIEVEWVNQEKRLVEFAGCITLAGKRQCLYVLHMFISYVAQQL